MSNFLSHLVTRSFGAATGIRPRVASLFEPATRLPGAFVDPGDGNPASESIAVQGAAETAGPDEEPEVNSGKNSEAPRRTGRRSSFRLAGSPPAGDPSQEGFQAESELRSTRGTIQRSPNLAPADHADGAFRSVEKALLAASSYSQETLVVSSQAESKTWPATPMVVPLDHKISMEQERSAPPALRPAIVPDGKSVSREGSRERSKDAAIPLSAQNAAQQAALLSNLVNHHAASRPANARAKQQSSLKFEGAQPEAEPSIYVTIGRVEVRAELAGHATGRAERKPSPVMGLEEYLRCRAKRGGE
jgi:hypothetical protein